MYIFTQKQHKEQDFNQDLIKPKLPFSAATYKSKIKIMTPKSFILEVKIKISKANNIYII